MKVLLLLCSSLFLALSIVAVPTSFTGSSIEEGPNSFSVIPQYEHGVPSNTLYARYAYTSNDEMGLTDEVNVYISTSIPAINLDNIKGLTEVSCTKNSLILSLSSSSFVLDWEKSDKFVVLVSPSWNCVDQQKTVYLEASNLKVLDKTDVRFSTRQVSLNYYVESFNVSASQIKPVDNSGKRNEEVGRKNPKRDYITGLDVKWNPPTKLELGTLSAVHDIKAFCSNCQVNGNILLTVNVTKQSSSLALPKIRVDMSGQLLSNLDVLIEAGPRENLTESTTTIFKSAFRKFSVPGFFDIDPAFALQFGAIVPAGAGVNITTGFDLKIPTFKTKIIGGSEESSSQEGFSPKFKIHPFMIKPGLSGDQLFKAGISLTPKIILDMILLDDMPYTVGIGIDNLMQGSVHTGFYAQLKCNDDEISIRADASSRLQSYTGSDTFSLKPWFGSNLMDECIKA